VCKSQPAEIVRAAARAGLAEFGESYVQEALAKIEVLKDLPLIWHFVGKVQSNKTGTLPRTLPGCTVLIACAPLSASPHNGRSTQRR